MHNVKQLNAANKFKIHYQIWGFHKNRRSTNDHRVLTCNKNKIKLEKATYN